MNNIPDTEEFERCIMCGSLTSIPISMPIDWRENYEIGLGQICAECAKKRQNPIECKNTLINVKNLQVMGQSREKTKK